LRDSRAAFVWLVTILRSHLRELYKRRSRRTLELDADPSLSEQLIPPELPKQELDAGSLHVAIQSLPEEFRQPVVLYYFGELRYREIAEICECPIGTVMSRLARGKAMLRSILTDSSVDGVSNPSHISGSHSG
jgi:RNA polymerase sigma-70 factor (ECF subfamily)